MVDRDFDPDWVETLGRACGTYFQQNGQKKAIVGRDCRHSSPLYQARIIEGLVSTGIEVIYLPMTPTPVFYYAIKSLNRQAGVMITASHNPPEYNGFKIWSGNNTIHTDEIQQLYHIMKSKNFIQGNGLANEYDILPDYLEELSQQTRLFNPLTIVVDGGNGTAGEVCSELLERIGAKVIPLYCDPDPDFPNHHPDPTVLTNIKDLIIKVKEHQANFGVGLDGDGDRIGVVDDQGQLMYGDQLLAIFARDVLKTKPEARIIGEVKCSHLLFKDINDHAGAPLMWKTGHSLIKAKMKETKALLAGEMSGHMFFADRYYGYDDAIYAALRLAEIVGKDPSTPLSSYLADWPPTFNTPEIRLECPDTIKFDLVDKALDYFQTLPYDYEIINVDGIRINFGDGWGLLRASNTQPVLVLRFEAETNNRLEEIRSFMERPIQKWIQEMSK
jgi:phosphomannomutase/phosphoglucomutase